MNAVRILCAVALICGLGGTRVHAQTVVAEYYAMLTGVDLANSSGQPLSEYCAILQQDRANVHRFGRAHDSDQWDPVFDDPAARAQIGPLCRAAGGFPELANALRTYGSQYVFVRVFSSGGQLTGIAVYQGAG